MATISTPELTISASTRIHRSRILPVEGKVLAEVGSKVKNDDIVAHTLLPGALHPIRIAAALGLPPKELKSALTVAEGDSVCRGEPLAETKALWGLWRNSVVAPIDGIVESVSFVTGQMLLRELPRPLNLRAYIPGTVVDVIENRGVHLETDVALIQGIFGIGNEAFGTLKVIDSSSNSVLDARLVSEAHAGAIIAWNKKVSFAALNRMREVGVRGLVAASVDGADLTRLIGRKVNPAATGDESEDFTMVLTEGFGNLTMGHTTSELLVCLDNTSVSVNGTTQVRAGVIRPEIIAPAVEASAPLEIDRPAFHITDGSYVRIVRGKALGRTGRISRVPKQPQKVDSEVTTLVYEIDLDSGETITVPRPNVEQIIVRKPVEI
jgi:hypothetical protein